MNHEKIIDFFGRKDGHWTSGEWQKYLLSLEDDDIDLSLISHLLEDFEATEKGGF